MHMASPLSATGLKGLNAKHYILSALIAILAMAVVVTAFFIVLSPARIEFSVTDASSHRLSSPGNGDDGVLLSLTLAANNTSRRAAVRYQSMFIDVSNITGPQFENWARANATTPGGGAPQWQPCASVATVNATAAMLGGWMKDFTRNMTNGKFSVRVTAVARFRVGFARTRLYDIMVFCGPIDFFSRNNSRGSAAASAGQPPVRCA